MQRSRNQAHVSVSQKRMKGSGAVLYSFVTWKFCENMSSVSGEVARRGGSEHGGGKEWGRGGGRNRGRNRGDAERAKDQKREFINEWTNEAEKALAGISETVTRHGLDEVVGRTELRETHSSHNRVYIFPRASRYHRHFERGFTGHYLRYTF
jgi:hypothetical protein